MADEYSPIDLNLAEPLAIWLCIQTSAMRELKYIEP